MNYCPVNFYLVWFFVTADRQTDAKQCIRAHRALKNKAARPPSVRNTCYSLTIMYYLTILLIIGQGFSSTDSTHSDHGFPAALAHIDDQANMFSCLILECHESMRYAMPSACKQINNQFDRQRGSWSLLKTYSKIIHKNTIEQHHAKTDSRITWRIHWVMICMHKNCKMLLGWSFMWTALNYVTLLLLVWHRQVLAWHG